MQILKRTQGIDLKAKTGVIRGEVCFQLKDDLTGKITHEERGHNMLTNGLDSVLNKCPFGLDKVSAMYQNVSTEQFSITPIFRQLLGGVIAFPSALGNDADLLFPDFDNSPTAFASCATYDQLDSRQGVYDNVSSDLITNGFRHVFSWGSSFGNGQIASLGLAPINAHTWCYNPANMFKPYDTASPSRGYYRQFDGVGGGGNASKILAICTTGTLVLNANMNNSLCFYKNAPYALNLFQRYQSNKVFLTTTPFDYDYQDLDKLDGYDWTYALGLDVLDFTAEIIGSYVYVITRSSSTFTVVKLNLADGTVASTDTYTFSASFGGTKAVLVGDYIYCASSTAGTIYKCNITNTADVTEIEATGIEASAPLFFTNSQWVYGENFILDTESDKVVVASANLFDLGYKSGYRVWQFPIYENGMWLVFHGTSGGMSTWAQLGATIKQWGLMTHYDLQNTVTKNAQKQMLIQYSITQV